MGVESADPKFGVGAKCMGDLLEDFLNGGVVRDVIGKDHEGVGVSGGEDSEGRGFPLVGVAGHGDDVVEDVSVAVDVHGSPRKSSFRTRKCQDPCGKARE
jgi:hypothetical protein